MATTEGRIATAPRLEDLLERIEALEAASAGEVKKTNKLTIIAWGGELDRIWPTTILATTAAASGMESSVFFTFWGLFAIVKPGVRITGDNWMQKMMSAMNPGSAQKAKLSRYHFAGAGPTMFLLGLKREDLLDGLEEPIGAATALAEMRTAAVSLFI